MLCCASSNLIHLVFPTSLDHITGQVQVCDIIFNVVHTTMHFSGCVSMIKQCTILCVCMSIHTFPGMQKQEKDKELVFLKLIQMQQTKNIK